jgi:hypothetical protein
LCTKAPDSFDDQGDTVGISQCGFKDVTITYGQFKSLSTMNEQVTSLGNQQGAARKSWSGGGLTGQYYFVDEGGVSALFATVDNQPVAIVIVNTNSSGTTTSSENLESLFNDYVKPR